MQIREVDIKDFFKVINWLRNGASPAEKPVNKTVPEICMMTGITYFQFQSIKQKYEKKRIRETKPAARQRKRPVLAEKAEGGNRTFRKEWPFLSRADCPPELKALAADKITAWERYTAAHKKLFDCKSLEECSKTAHELIENYKDNQLIHEEFEYYLEHGEVLGKHRIWNHLKKYKELRGKNIIELVKLHENTLPHKIWRIESEIKKGDKPHLLGQREKRLAEVKSELAEVKRLLGIKE